MVSKKLLSAAIAAAFISTPAFAVIDLDTDADAVKYAKEAVVDADYDAGFLTVAAAGTELQVDTVIGTGVTADNQVYVRFDLTNAKFVTPVVGADLSTSGTASSITVQQGGGAGQSFVIFQITAGVGDIAQTDSLSLALADLAVSTSAGVTVSYAAYDTPSAAVNQTAANRLASSSFANAITVANALTVDFDDSNVVADVSTDFQEFVTTGTTATLGTVEFVLDTDALLPTGTAVASLADVINDGAGESALALTGDLSFGDWTIGALDVDEDTGMVDVDGAVANTVYDVVVTVDGATTINPGAYSLATDFVGVTDAVFGPADASGSLGNITRNGTSIQVPYLTTFADYNQRIVLVNRSNKAAPYSISFTEEAGVTATAGVKATGSIPANETLILKATDVVTIAGSTRTAATITVTAQEANIDAATTMVNLSDKSTDTVNLQ
jgi:hypothetical protein